MKTMCLIILIAVSLASPTQWQPPTVISYTGLTPSFAYDNLKMYVTVTDGSPTSNNIGYNTWNGSSWDWGDDVYGDIRTATYNESEPFITYDNQTMYFVRSGISGNFSAIYTAARQGSSEIFNGSVALGPQINNINGQPFASYPSITQDQQKMYFTAKQESRWQIFEAIWNGSDWDNVILLPTEVNGTDNNDRTEVCITPDGSELYFCVDNYPPKVMLAFSRKIGGVWQQWQYCDQNINTTEPSVIISGTGITYGSYTQQELYFARYIPSTGYRYKTLRSPVTVQPTSLGSIKAMYGSK